MTRRPALGTSPVGKWAEAAGLCLCAAVVLFASGALTGLNVRPVRPCVEALVEKRGPNTYRTPDADIAIHRTLVPVSVLCEFPGGTRVELVSPWVNPLLALSLVGAAGCAAGTVRAATARRTARRAGHPAF